MKIPTKILLLFAGLTVSTILMMSILVYYFANQHSFEDFYKRLEIRAYLSAKATLPYYESDSAIYNEIREEHLEKLPSEKEYFLPVAAGGSIHNNEQLALPTDFYSQVIREKKATYREGDRFYEEVLNKRNKAL